MELKLLHYDDVQLQYTVCARANSQIKRRGKIRSFQGYKVVTS